MELNRPVANAVNIQIAKLLAENAALRARVEELERVFNHYHKRSDDANLCAHCRLDLRDEIHRRILDDRSQPIIF